MSHKSDIGITIFDEGKVSVNINGWAICRIAYHEDILIKTKEDAIEIAKSIVTLLEFKYGEVKNEDYPNDEKAMPDTEMVEGYEIPQYTAEEWAEREKEFDSLGIMDLLRMMEE